MTTVAALVMLAYVVALLVRVWLRIRRTRKRVAAMLEARRRNHATDLHRIMHARVQEWDEAAAHRQWRSSRYRK